MIKAGILDHDYIVARKQNFANNGDIVVALIDGEKQQLSVIFVNYVNSSINQKMMPILP